jgi:hypothetical protein
MNPLAEELIPSSAPGRHGSLSTSRAPLKGKAISSTSGLGSYAKQPIDAAVHQFNIERILGAMDFSDHSLTRWDDGFCSGQVRLANIRADNLEARCILIGKQVEVIGMISV